MNGMFCQKCGALMILDSDRKKMNCGSCGYSPRGKADNIILKEKVNLTKEQEIELQDKKIETLPKVNEVCSKCNNKKAYYWTLQTRAADESETRFFECTKCSHRWRVY
jgi:DNA-directed RNA polymerase subunit M|tara:strand:+ start:72 stop:395 length:324 start_codon:yes stop_codon:yes gene_type:complete